MSSCDLFPLAALVAPKKVPDDGEKLLEPRD